MERTEHVASTSNTSVQVSSCSECVQTLYYDKSRFDKYTVAMSFT